jgi:hypothetical protein
MGQLHTLLSRVRCLLRVLCHPEQASAEHWQQRGHQAALALSLPSQLLLHLMLLLRLLLLLLPMMVVVLLLPLLCLSPFSQSPCVLA